jgi:hypothetical protein
MIEYEIYTAISGDFDPEVEGVTLVSILESCEGYVNHSIPFGRKEIMIKMTTSQFLDEKYLIDQLNDNFRAMGEKESMVKEIVRKSL